MTDRLPNIPIPLKEGDREVSLDLQAALNQVYDDAGYENYLYIDAQPNPPLTTEQEQWATGLLGRLESRCESGQRAEQSRKWGQATESGTGGI